VPDPRRDPPRAPAARPAPKAVIGRLSLYLRQLESLERRGEARVSSRSLGESLGLNDAQVRKDLANFGQFGYPGIGYHTAELIPALRQILGIDRSWTAALIGLGNLGRALLRYRGFRARGFHVSALFDNDPRKVGTTLEKLVVHPIEALPQQAAALGLELAILAVPADSAQRVADLVAASRIGGILNFAPAALVVPDTVHVVAVDLSVQLEQLAYAIRHGRDDISCAG